MPRGSQNYSIHFRILNEEQTQEELKQSGLPEVEIDSAAKHSGFIYNTDLYTNDFGLLSRTVFINSDKVHTSVSQWKNASDEFVAGEDMDIAGITMDRTAVDADSEYEACFVMHKKLLDYRLKGFSITKGLILVDGWKNVYLLEGQNQKAQVEFDLRKTLPRIGIKSFLANTGAPGNDIGALMFVIPAFAILASYRADAFMHEFVDSLDRLTRSEFYKKFPMEDNRSWLEKFIS